MSDQREATSAAPTATQAAGGGGGGGGGTSNATLQEFASEPEGLTGGRLTIDRDAIAANWQMLQSRLKEGCVCGATIKADGYGTGAAGTAQRLWEAGCRTFFVALPAEGRVVRRATPDADVFILGGLFPGRAAAYVESQLIPVLNSVPEVREWSAFCAAAGAKHKAALQLDSGMNRVGMKPADFADIMAATDVMEHIDVCLLMTHLACGSDVANPKNQQQLQVFLEATAPFPGIRRSMANSAGVFLGEAYHFDLARPGIAMYGGRALDEGPNPMTPCAMAEVRVMMVNTVKPGETIGYAGAQTAQRDMRIAIVAAGYADGLHRRAGSSDGAPGAAAWCAGHRLPYAGRVSMDMIALDITDVPVGVVERGTFVEMLGPHVSAHEVATCAQTIDYELLTGLGHRYRRVYAPLPKVQEG